MRLPPQPWTDSAGARALFAALDVAGGMTRVVGGAVRDAMLGHAGSDIDLATRFLPQETQARLEAAGLKAIPTGIAHGTITAVSHGQVFELTTLRRDVSTDGRHAVVAFTDAWEEDASRRDFTINALYADPLTGELFDYFGGLDDLAARRVRFIGEPLQRIAEDHLRILRFFRFHARFGDGPPDSDGFEACAARANDLMALSRERIRDELLKLLCVVDPVSTLDAMLGRAILAPVLPEIGAARLPDLARLVAVEHDLHLDCVALRRLAALLPPDPTLLDEIGARLRLSNVERKRLVAMADRPTEIPVDPKPLAYRAGLECAIDRLLLASVGADDIRMQLAALNGWRRPPLPFSGKDLIRLGVPEGPEVSRTLRIAEDEWIAAGFPSERDAALAIAAQAAEKASR